MPLTDSVHLNENVQLQDSREEIAAWLESKTLDNHLNDEDCELDEDFAVGYM